MLAGRWLCLLAHVLTRGIPKSDDTQGVLPEVCTQCAKTHGGATQRVRVLATQVATGRPHAFGGHTSRPERMGCPSAP